MANCQYNERNYVNLPYFKTLFLVAVFTCFAIAVVCGFHYMLTGDSFLRPVYEEDETSIRKSLKYWLRKEVARSILDAQKMRAKGRGTNRSVSFGSARNFASAAAGATVVDSSDTWKGGHPHQYLLVIPLANKAPPPVTVLKPTRDIGDCWPMNGSDGHLLIHLAAKAYVEAFTLEHAPKNLHLGGFASEAPKNFSVFGVDELTGKNNKHFFGSYEYDLNGPSYQLFPVLYHSERPFWLIDLVINSNHGHTFCTCIYRFMVHGRMDDRQCLL